MKNNRNSIKVVRRESVGAQRENRKARDIRALGYLQAVTEGKPKRFYINSNRGISL